MPRFALLLTACVLAGCAITAPPAQVDAVPPPAWQAPLPHAGTLDDLRQWWQQLGDPLLVELLDAAQAASPTLSSARARIEQARATRVAADAALAPSLTGVASAVRSNTQPPLPTSTVVQAGLQTAWEIDLFGANRRSAAAAEARLAGAEAGWHDARVAVAAETANSYLGLRTCQQQLVVTQRDAASRAETARVTQLSTDAGFTAPASAALARASAAEGSARLRQQQAQCELELKTIVALTAVAEPALRQRLGAPALPDALPALPRVSAVPAQLLLQRPDVYQSELDVAAASAEVGAARADRYPRLSLSGSIAVGRVRLGGADSDAQTWSIGPLALSVPIFDGGRRRANDQAAQARYDDAVTQYRARVRLAVREVEQALVTLDSAQARNDDARIAADGFQASFAATEARYRSGLASLVELEDARRTLLAAQTALVSLQRERSAAWVALYRAVGGGWRRGDPVTAAAPACSTASAGNCP